MPIVFGDKLVSTLADGKLIDASAIDGQIDGDQLKDGTVGETQLAANSVTSQAVKDGTLQPADLHADTGVASTTTFYRGDGAWAEPPGGGGSAFTPTKENIYPAVKDIVAATGAGLTVDDSDADSTVTLSIPENGVTEAQLANDAKLTQANIFAAVDAILQTPTSTSTIEGLTIANGDDPDTVELSISRDIIGEDWGNLPVGFRFAEGRMVPRSGQYYICIEAHQKGSTGPDNDTTHWEAVTSWTGAYSGTRWYHSGHVALLSNGGLAIAKKDVSPNTTEPAATNDTWWVSNTPIKATEIYPALKTILAAVSGVGIRVDDTGETLTFTITEVDAAQLYEGTKTVIKSGNNVNIVPNDTKNELVVNVRLPDTAAPRVYALDSRDVRTVQPPYSYNFITEGFTCDPDVERREPGPVSIHDIDNDRPGFARDDRPTFARNNANGKQFTNQTAGTTDRVISVSTEVTLANERQYSSAETLTMRVYTFGYLKPNNTPQHPENYLTFTKTFNFQGGFQDAFHYDFDLTFRLNPRSGEHDSWRVTWEWQTGSGEVVAGIVDAVKYTLTLPALGEIPTQEWTHHSRQLIPTTLDDWIPPELKPELNAAAMIMTWAVGTPNNTGKNAPNESDKADVTDPVVAFANNVIDKPFLRAEQDLSRVKLHFAGGATAGGGDVYLCTRIQGFPAQILANTNVDSAWTLDYTAQGVMADQDFYLIDPTGSGVGSPTASWDANPRRTEDQQRDRRYLPHGAPRRWHQLHTRDHAHIHYR